jgi:hypothetical protein
MGPLCRQPERVAHKLKMVRFESQDLVSFAE